MNNEYEKLELYFSCRNLPNLDTFSLTDAKLKLFVLDNNSWIKVGESEVVWDNLNPDFSTTFVIDYFFEKQQYFKVEVIDIDDEKDHSKFDYVGFHEFELGKLVGSNKVYFENLTDYNKNNRGNIIIRYEKVFKNKKLYNFDIQCKNIKNLRWFFKNNPFIKIYKYIGKNQIDDNYSQIAQNQWLLTYQSEIIYNNLNPLYKNIKINSSKLCSNNINLPLKFEIWDYYNVGNHQLIGYNYFRLYNIINDNNFKFLIEKNNNKCGEINFLDFKEEDDYDIIDYIRYGLQIHTCISVDFTASNWEPYCEDSLHYINSTDKNLYEKSIEGVANILLNYDFYKEIPLFGFGFKLANENDVKLIHPLTNDWNNTTVNGIDNILRVYRNTLNNINFSGPTYFAPIIETIINIIKNNPNINNKSYYVLTLLTDGINHDMDKTIDMIVKASDLPLSIIIIGIGNADFTNMDILDGDDEPLIDSNGKKTLRDIVQFVPFNKYLNSPIELTKEVLFEIPTQIKEYYKLKKINPNDNFNS